MIPVSRALQEALGRAIQFALHRHLERSDVIRPADCLIESGLSTLHPL